MTRLEAAIPRSALAALAIATCLAGTAGADEVLFTNGDRITGMITQGAGGQLTIKSDTVGEVKVDMSKVKTFSTTQPVRVQVARRPSSTPRSRSAPTGPSSATCPAPPARR